MTNEGPCLGGPRDGTWLAHGGHVIVVHRRPSLLRAGDKLGEYHWEFGCWVWRPERSSA